MADTRAGGGNQLTGRLYVAAAVSAVAAVLYGYDTGIISGALLQIDDDFDIGSTWKQLIAASILLGAIIGALACSRLSERRGRRGTILIIAVIFVVGAICCMLAPDKFTLSLSRILLGFAVGGGDAGRPDVRRRARARAGARPPRAHLPGRASASGIVLSTIVGATEALDWRIAIGIAADPGGGHVRPHAAAPGEPALARQARQPRRGARGADAAPSRRRRHRRRGPGDHRHREGGARGVDQRLGRPAQALGPPGADRRLRHRGLHAALGDRDDHLLRPDDPHRQRLLRLRRAARERRARRHLPGDDDRRPLDRGPRRTAAPQHDHDPRRRAQPDRPRRDLRLRARRQEHDRADHRLPRSSSCSSTPAGCSSWAG